VEEAPVAATFRIGWGADPAEFFDILIPDEQRPEDGWPLMMFVPGGGLTTVNPPPPAFTQFLLTEQRCMVVSVNYQVGRGAVAALEDVATVARLVFDHAQQWSANPDRIGWIGHSAGGFLLAEVALDDRFDVQRPPYGMCLLAPAWLDHDANFTGIQHPFTRSATERAFGTPQNWADLCPIEHLDGPRCRGVVVYGTNDDQIPHDNWSRDFVVRAAAQGHDFRLMVLPGRGHDIDPARDSDAALAVFWTLFGT
jgi:acetyl esterase/lipase